MSLGSPLIRYWYHPSPQMVGESVEAFLREMAGPTLIHIPGRDRSRARAICTLLHGNEPSGTRALFRFLQEGIEPAVDLLCFFGSVQTALQEPLFFYRHLPQERDLNRCFREPFDDPQGRLAKAILDILQELNPEALIDIHNTSGMGPCFAVSMKQDPAHDALTSLFTERMLVTGLKLGALFEYSERNVPTVTIECGGAQDPRADQIAYEGILRYATREDVLTPVDADWDLEILREPVRLELREDASITYSEAEDVYADITLPPDVEHHNFGRINPDVALGWVKPESWDKLIVHTPAGVDVKDKVLKLEGNRLYPAQALKLFMITTNATIAKSDCLFYAVTDNGSHLA
ncbi:succinylglutamate desuccinylase/aspartoacylase family protein [Ketobacter sp.]|uniref:succinylglutamate desuccinylase/aspartoacylase domain-containing protein n=1 Tax=Ketobacter sp. TaxID=2083498 RepID=UPI0025BF9546|nr:succinylglutamate desuccinylase/aspartoacylase family protein [Ketobacter sp.]